MLSFDSFLQASKVLLSLISFAMNVYILIVSLCVAINAANAELRPRELSRLTTPLSVGFLHHSRLVQKRQTLDDITDQDLIECSAASIESQCSSGLAQEAIDISLECGQADIARPISIACARNAAGTTCQEATLRITQEQLTMAAQCTGVVQTGTCPSACSEFLRTQSSTLGCCINTYINTTDSPLYQQYSNLVDYRLWNECNVPLPPAGCGNALPVNRPSNARNCTTTEYINRLVNYECTSNAGQQLVDALLQNTRCYPVARLQADACGRNDNGLFCAQAIGQDLLGSESTNSLVVSLITCGVSTSTCDPFCQGVIANASDVFGCCVNVYNNSDIGFEFPSLSYSYWDSCGVETPGFCTSTLSSSTAIKAFTWLVAAAMAFGLVIVRV